MRGAVEGLATPFPLADSLPGLLQDDAFVQRLCAGLDEVLAPVVATLDGLPAYLDPGTAPLDVLQWLAGWVGLVPDDAAAPDRRRDLVRRAPSLQRQRGTAAGVRAAVEAWCGIEPEVIESGGATWSADPGAPLPGEPEPFVRVRLEVPRGRSVDVDALDAVVAAMVPAHVPHHVEVVPADDDGVAGNDGAEPGTRGGA